MVDSGAASHVLALIIVDVSLHAAPNSSPYQSFTFNSLHFLCFYDTLRVPLHLTAGPYHVLLPEGDDGRAWFCNVLLRQQLDLPTHRVAADSGEQAHCRIQYGALESRVGVLFEVVGFGESDDAPRRPRVTQMLVYATSKAPGTSTKVDALTRSDPRDVAFYALPLSSDLIYPPLHMNTGQPAEPRQRERSASEDPSFPIDDGLSKRSRIDELFDNASTRNKKARRKAATTSDLLRTNISTPQAGKLAGHPIGSDQSAITVAASPLVDPAISSDPFADTSFAARNQKNISRTIMAGMRIRGLKQTKPSTVTPKADAEVPAGFQDNESDTEYKAVYHQVYKATIFTFVSLSAGIACVSQLTRL